METYNYGMAIMIVLVIIFGYVLYRIIIYGEDDNSSKELEEHEQESSDFTIEHYPLSARYYPKYKNNYLKFHKALGIYREEDFFDVASYGDIEKEALRIIDMFKEQQLKNNVKIIKVK